MPVWIKLGNTDIIFPNEELMLKTLKEAGIPLEKVIIVNKKD
ncbi:hypothetical protein [Sulfurisphaera javensis]